VHLEAALAILAALLVVAVVACAVAWVIHARRTRPPSAEPAALLTTLEAHGDRLHDLHGALGDELENWAEVEVDIRRRILAADAAVQAHAYGRRSTDAYAVRAGTRDEREPST
jgi:hypothetical protein